MIAYLKGKIILNNSGLIILSVNNTGHRVAVAAANNFVVGSEVELFIHEHIREDADDLYGFVSYDELILFEKLISVNGVGPKAGLNIMSAAPALRIISAIAGEDVSFFMSIPGIGKKVAAKIILDLKSKLSGLESSSIIGKIDEAAEVVDTLVGLGYKKPEIMKAMSKIPENIAGTEDKIRWCLKNLAK